MSRSRRCASDRQRIRHSRTAQLAQGYDGNERSVPDPSLRRGARASDQNHRRLCLQASQKAHPGDGWQPLYRNHMGTRLCAARPSAHVSCEHSYSAQMIVMRAMTSLKSRLKNASAAALIAMPLAEPNRHDPGPGDRRWLREQYPDRKALAPPCASASHDALSAASRCRPARASCRSGCSAYATMSRRLSMATFHLLSWPMLPV